MNAYLASAAWDALLGFCVGDALGVPVEFMKREELRANPVKNMRVGGVHGQSAGTWSDDSSMTFCLAASIAERDGIDAEDVMRRFARWLDGEYTPHGQAFDVGMTSKEAIGRFKSGMPLAQCGGADEHDNGNGALMRILPAILFLTSKHGRKFLDDSGAAQSFHDIVAITHAHPRNLMACRIYADVAARLLEGGSLVSALGGALRRMPREGVEKESFALLWKPRQHPLRAAAQFRSLPEDKIQSGGYVVHTLEAALWCLLSTDDYASCVLKAVNLGGDADTVAAIAGGLAGLAYGAKQIPGAWLNTLARQEWVFGLCDAFQQCLRRTHIASRA